MNYGILGALVGGLLCLTLFFLAHPKTKGQRLGLFFSITGFAMIPSAIGSLVDQKIQQDADIIDEQRVIVQQQQAREEMRKEFLGTRKEMTASVREILKAIHDLPPGPKRTKAIQSALLNYDRAAFQLGPEASTGVSDLLPLAVEASLVTPRPTRGAPPAAQQSTNSTEILGKIATTKAAPREEATTEVQPAIMPPPVVAPVMTLLPIIPPRAEIPPPPPPMVEVPPPPT